MFHRSLLRKLEGNQLKPADAPEFEHNGGEDYQSHLTGWVEYVTEHLMPIIKSLNTELEGNIFSSHLTFDENVEMQDKQSNCLLYTSPSPRDRQKSRMPSSA